LASANLAATCEATVAGLRAGLNLEQMIDVINVSTGASFMSAHVFPENVIPQTFDSGFAGTLLFKDLKLYAESIENINAPYEISHTSLSLWEDFIKENPNGDVSEMFKFLNQEQVNIK